MIARRVNNSLVPASIYYDSLVIVEGYMKNKKVIVLNDLNGKNFKFTIDRSKLSKGIANAIEGISCTNRKNLKPTFANNTKIKSVKFKDKKVESNLQDVALNDKKSSNSGESSYNKKSLSYPAHLNPFTPALSKIKFDRYESLKLKEFLGEIVKTKGISQLNEVVDKALKSGIRINAYSKIGHSLSNFVMMKVHVDKFKEDEKRDIIRKLILKGAIFDDNLLQHNKKANELCNELRKEVQPQLDDQIRKLRDVAENSSAGGIVKNVEIDNSTFYIEFSESSVVDVKKVIDGTKNLGLNKGDLKLGGDIVKIGESEVEVKAEADGKINYLGLSDNSCIKITFHTNRGDLNINLFHDQNYYNEVQVRVNNPKLWDELKTTAVVKNCLLGGVPIEKAVEKGSFVRCGRLGIEKDPIKDTWVNKVRKSNETTSLVL